MYEESLEFLLHHNHVKIVEFIASDRHTNKMRNKVIESEQFI